MKKVVLSFGLVLFAVPLFADSSNTVPLLEEEEGLTCHAWACYYAERAAENGGDVDQAYEVAYTNCTDDPMN
jgi:hypothetical protein